MNNRQLETVIEFSNSDKRSSQPDNEVANQQLRQLLEESIERLPEHFRSVFMLRAIESCSVRETAEILSIAEATVKTRYFRAKVLLQEHLNQTIEAKGLSIFEFAGARCDAVVRGVLTKLSAF